MKTQPPPEIIPEVLARDRLQQQHTPKSRESSRLFEVLYNFLLFAAIPVAFEMSYVKIFQHTLNAYEVNDVVAMSRLVIYLTIQWLLGILVRRKYVAPTLKRITLVLMIMIQVKDAFFEEVLLDMMMSMILESGLAILLFIKFAQLMVILKFMGLLMVVAGIAFYLFERPLTEQLQPLYKKFSSLNTRFFMQIIKKCRGLYMWHQHSYCSMHSHNIQA